MTMKPLLVTKKQVHELLGITVETASMLTDFPKPVDIDIPRVRYRLADIKQWVKKLETKKK